MPWVALAARVRLDAWCGGVVFGSVNQVLVRLWARRQVSGFGSRVSEVSDPGAGPDGLGVVRLHV
jgi:hypothetical protein